MVVWFADPRGPKLFKWSSKRRRCFLGSQGRQQRPFAHLFGEWY